MENENNNVEEVKEEIIVANQDNSEIKIADDVVAVIAGVAVSEVNGVAGMAGGFAGGITEVLSGKKNLAKGIKVEVQEQVVKVDVALNIRFGYAIPEVSTKVQERVKSAIENMTGLEVSNINVRIAGVNLEKRK